MKLSLGIIGLGAMGHAMASRLIEQNFDVFGLDLAIEQQQKAKAIGVKLCEDIKSLCTQVDIIILSLPMANHVEKVILGDDGIQKHAQENTLIIDTSTSDPLVTKRISKAIQTDKIKMLDCPVSGGPKGAASGTMVMLVGGDADDLARAKEYINPLTKKIVHLGESGNGHSAKLLNNLLCAAHLVTTAETIAIGKKIGLNPETLIQGLNAGSGASAVSQNNFPNWILNEAYDSGFTMQLMRKDLRLAASLLEQMEIEPVVSKLITQIWQNSIQEIDNDKDFNSIVKDIIN